MVLGRGVVGTNHTPPQYHIEIDSGFEMQKGIPIGIVRQKSVRHKNCKIICTICLEIYA
jgi:hypothetical protein